MRKSTIIWILLLTVLFLAIYIIPKSKSTSSSSTTLLTKGPKSLLPPCLQTHNTSQILKHPFNMSKVHFDAPNILGILTRNKTGFEIGAPSQATWGNLGVYDAAAVVDTANFATNTLWESKLKDSGIFLWNKQPKGKQYIRDAIDLHGIPNEYYDFVCASHVIEHIANPFKALIEWLRILRPGGLLMIIAPLKFESFDIKRDIVKIEHLINDFHNQTSEADLSHLDEVLRLHDLGRDKLAGSLEKFTERSKKNFEIRGLHHHVYDQELLYNIFMCLNLEVTNQFIWSNNNLILGRKR